MLQGNMASSFTEARRRQLARLGGAKPPAPRAAMALAKSQAYQDAADAPATLRAYAADLANYKAWCGRHGFEPMPATPEIVGAYWRQPGKATPFRHCVVVSLRSHEPAGSRAILWIPSIRQSGRRFAVLAGSTEHQPADRPR